MGWSFNSWLKSWAWFQKGKKLINNPRYNLRTLKTKVLSTSFGHICPPQDKCVQTSSIVVLKIFAQVRKSFVESTPCSTRILCIKAANIVICPYKTYSFYSFPQLILISHCLLEPTASRSLLHTHTLSSGFKFHNQIITFPEWTFVLWQADVKM